MNILIISNLYPPNVVGGYERLCFETASALVEGNHRVSVLTSNYGGRLADYPGQDADRSLRMLADTDDIYKGFSASESEKKAINDHNLAVLECKLATVQPDVVFVWNLFFLDVSFLSAIQSSGVRTVFLLTDNWLILFLKPAFWYRYFTGGVLASRSWPAVIRSALGNLRVRMFPDNISIAGEAIFPSRFMQAFYAQAGCRFQKTVVIPHGVHLTPHDEASYRNRMETVKKGEIHLLFAGRVVEMKGVHTILESLPEIVRGLPDTSVRLTVMGDCQDRQYQDRLETIIRRCHLEGVVTFRYPVPESNLFTVFQEYDIFLFPSLYEPFSLTLIHAMAAGIPVAASDVGGNREIVFPEKTGLLFPRADAQALAGAVLRLAANAGLRRELAMAGRETAGRFTFQAMVQQVEAYLQAPSGWEAAERTRGR